ncbi:uncharacterized protein LOC143342669 [Colletes latitarsis]|uniref:uncharacterized protein LOC143342669 n=1 Tax=Colletes latitarsis TaxID=2605962 RepID=UPI0040357E52
MLRPPRQSFIINELNIVNRTAVDWASFRRELCILWAEKHSVMLGGENETVGIDEAKIRKSVRGRRKYKKGRIITGHWIFGGFERTTIISDCWKAYDCLNTEGYIHLKVNHKINFVDPMTEAHTQHIERIWRETRANIPRYGTRSYHYIGYIAEFMFRRTYNFDNRIMSFFDVMADIFPANNGTTIE